MCATEGRRLIIVVLGSEASKTRDFKVMELAELGFSSPAAALPVVKTGGASAPSVPAAARPVGPVAKPSTPAAIPTVKTDKSVEQTSTPKEPMFKLPVFPPEKKP